MKKLHLQFYKIIVPEVIIKLEQLIFTIKEYLPFDRTCLPAEPLRQFDRLGSYHPSRCKNAMVPYQQIT